MFLFCTFATLASVWCGQSVIWVQRLCGLVKTVKSGARGQEGDRWSPNLWVPQRLSNIDRSQQLASKHQTQHHQGHHHPPTSPWIAVFAASRHGNQGDSHKIPIPGATPQIYHGIIGEFITELWNTRFLSQTTYILHFVGLEIHLRTSSRLQMLKFYRSLKKDNFRQFFLRLFVLRLPPHL